MERYRWLLVGLLIIAPVAPLATAQGDAPVEPSAGDGTFPLVRSIREMAQIHADAFPVDPLPPDLGPQEVGRYIVEERIAAGRTPMDWIAWSTETFALDVDTPAAVPTGPSSDGVASLTARLVDLYEAAGLAVTDADRARFAANAAGLPPTVLNPLADLIGVVADVYADQALLVDELAIRLETEGFELGDTFVTPAERDAMADRAANIVNAINDFRIQTLDVFDAEATAAATCLDTPECLVILGSAGADTYAQTYGGTQVFPDPILVVDPAGDDTYEISAGGADPLGLITLQKYPTLPTDGNGLAVSVVADYGGNDDYLYDGEVSAVQGTGSFGGIGILADYTGNDEYLTTMRRDAVGPTATFSLGYFDGGAQGHGYAGLGLLLDGTGNDVYSFDVESTGGHCLWAEAQGFGGAGGLGLAMDAAGEDDWLGDGLDLTQKAGVGCFGPGDALNPAFIGMYLQGSGFNGGVGIITDLGGDDDEYNVTNVATSPDYYSQGFGAFGGVGIQFDDGGDDDYWAYEESTTDNPAINPILNCAWGTGFLGAVGVFIDTGGNDEYHTHTVATSGSAGALTMAEGWAIGGYGFFMDVGGTDDHIMTATGTSTSDSFGRGENLDASLNSVSTFLELGGFDVYVGPPTAWTNVPPPQMPTPNNAVWAGGLDYDVIP